MLSWVSVDARTGDFLAELPDLVPQGPCVVTMGRYETLGFTLTYPDDVVAYAQQDASDRDPADPALQSLADWKAATSPGAAVLIALDESNTPIWGGLVLTVAQDHTEVATITTATMEAYLDRRYTGAYQVTGEDQNQIVADLINQFILDGTLPGLPIRVVNTASTAAPQSVTFNNYDDKTVYTNLGSLSAALNGPQWTIKWEWQASPQRITPVLYVADRLGSPVPAGFATANATFSMPGCVNTFTFTNDWSAGKGANRVTATGQGQGLTRPADTETVAAFGGRPMYEFRYAPPQPNLTAGVPNSALSVQQHALAALAALQNGTKAITLAADIATAPVLGLDYVLGDDIGYDLFAPGFIDGSLQGIGTCVGWMRDDTTGGPVLFTQDASQL